MRIKHWFSPFILAGSVLSHPVTAGDGTNNYQGHSAYRTQMNSGFSFSMGFRGQGNAHTQNRPLILHGVNFKFDSAELTPSSNTTLDKVAENLRQAPELAVDIGGHASAEGNDAYNLDLSQRRASAVRNYLIAHGVKARNMSATGFGEGRPLTSNVTEAGRSVNRRVELTRL